LVATRFVTGWLYNASGASVLIAGLFHATHNATVNQTGFAVTVLHLPQGEILYVLGALVTLAAVAITIATHGRLGAPQAPPEPPKERQTLPGSPSSVVAPAFAAELDLGGLLQLGALRGVRHAQAEAFDELIAKAGGANNRQRAQPSVKPLCNAVTIGRGVVSTARRNTSGRW
jgi:hypothetical protein